MEVDVVVAEVLFLAAIVESRGASSSSAPVGPSTWPCDKEAGELPQWGSVLCSLLGKCK